jgi:hypothetical protein
VILGTQGPYTVPNPSVTKIQWRRQPPFPRHKSRSHSVVALIKVASNATIGLMSRALEEVAREAIELSQEERLVLARILLEGCDLPGYPINEAEQTWEEEIANRIHAIDSGTTKARSWEDVLGDVDRRLAG